jgi:hypothetical protein
LHCPQNHNPVKAAAKKAGTGLGIAHLIRSMPIIPNDFLETLAIDQPPQPKTRTET